MDTKALRQKILDLAIRGKLVPQDPADEPASVLLERIRAEKQQMVKDGKLKAKDIKNDTVIYVGEDNQIAFVRKKVFFADPIIMTLKEFNRPQIGLNGVFGKIPFPQMVFECGLHFHCRITSV